MALIQDNHVVKQVSANLAIGVANRTDSASWGNSVQSAFSFFFRNLRYVLVTAYRPVSPDLHRRVPRYERSRWRGGRFACYAQHVMPQGGAFNCDFRFSLILLSHAKSIDCRRKKIQFP